MIRKFKYSLGSLLTGAGLFAFDWLTKWWANSHLPFQEPVHTWTSLWTWYRTYNKGYHYLFGEIQHFRLTQTLGLIAVIVLIYMMIDRRAELKKGDPSLHIFGAYIALLIGAIGNPMETLVFGRVTDFFVFTPLPWPSNLADQYINLAIYVLLPIWLIIAFRDWRAKKNSKEEEQTSESADTEQIKP